MFFRAAKPLGRAPQAKTQASALGRLQNWQIFRWSRGPISGDSVSISSVTQTPSRLSRLWEKAAPAFKSERGYSTLDMMLVVAGGAITYGVGLSFGISIPVAGVIAAAATVSYLYAVPATLNTTMFVFSHVRRFLRNNVIRPIINHTILPGANRQRAAMGKGPFRPIGKVAGEIHFRDLLSNIPISLYASLAGVSALGFIFGAPALLAAGGASLLHLGVMEALNRRRYPRGQRNIFNRFPWVRPEFKILDEDRPNSRIRRAIRYLREYNHALYQIERSFTIENIQDLGLLARWILNDPVRRRPALRITGALLSWGAFGWVSVGGIYWAANAVLNMGLSLPALLSAAGIFMYVLGALTVRWTTTIGFQGTMLQALKRDGTFFHSNEAERNHGAGLVPVPGHPITGRNDAETDFLTRILSDIGFRSEHQDMRMPKNITVHYVSVEPAAMTERSTWATYLIENRSLEAKLIHVNMTRGGRNFIAGNADAADNIRTQVEEWRERARSTPRTVPDYAALLRTYRDDYEARGNASIAQAIQVFETGQQGEAGALDERLGVDFIAHAQKWEEKAVALEVIDRLHQAGRITAAEIGEVMETYANYLEHRFTYDIIVNPRTYCYADPSFYTQLYYATAAALTPDTPLGEALDAASADEILDAAQVELERSGRTLGGEIYCRTPGEWDTWLTAFREQCIAEGHSRDYFLAVVLMEAIAQPSFGGGTKAGGQDNWYAKMGQVKVVIETPFLTDDLIADKPKKQVSTQLEFNMEDWRALSARLVDDAAHHEMLPVPPWFSTDLVEPLRREYRKIMTQLRLRSADPLTPLLAHRIAEAIENTHLADTSNRAHRERRRILERLEVIGVENGFTVSEFLGEALFVALNPRQVEWVNWRDFDFNGSFDKDYLPVSLNERTGEYDDVFRNVVPHLFRIQQAEGAHNVPVIQGNQFYASYIQWGPQVDPATYNGPMPIAQDSLGNYRLFDYQPLELTISATNIDQKTWYGAIISRIFRQLDQLVRETFSSSNPGTVQSFFDTAFDMAAGYLDVGVDRNRLRAELHGRHYPNLNWNAPLTPEMALEITERLLNHINQQATATGLLPGRDVMQAVFNCGTCRLENLVHMLSAYQKPYVIQRNGHILSQVEFAYDPGRREAMMRRYEPRFPNERGAQRSKESREHQRCRVMRLGGVRHLSRRRKAMVNAVLSQYNPESFSVDGRKLILRFANGDRRIVYWYWPGAPFERNNFNPEECRRVEVFYPSGGDKFYRDFEAQSFDRYYEIQRTGRYKRALIQTRRGGGQEELDNLEAIVQINRDTVNAFNIPGVGNFIDVEVFLADIQVTYVTGSYRERLVHPTVRMADKHITEDMESTYKQNERGYEARHFPHKL